MNSPITRFLLLLIVIAAITGIQLSNISRQPFDAHNFRQSQTLSTVELFVKDGIDLLHPRVNYYGEPGIIVLEFPIFQAICASAYKLLGQHIEIIRSFSLTLTATSALAVFSIVRRRFDRETAFASTILYLCSPLNQLYMASTLIDPFCVSFALWSFYFCDRLLEETASPRKDWLLFFIFSLVSGMVKPLYLFGVCVLIGVKFLATRRFTSPIIKASLTMLVVGAIFFAWNSYAVRVNDASFFTRDIRATMLLGFSELFTFAFVRRLGRWVLMDMLGPIGGVGIIGSFLLFFLPKSRVTSDQRLFLLTCLASVFAYWASFAHITFFHDYYSLIVVPFCAMACGITVVAAARELAGRPKGVAAGEALAAAFITLAAVGSLAFFTQARGFSPDNDAVDFARLSKGRFDRFSFAMIFIGPEKTPGGVPLADAPAMLYGAGLRGTANVVSDSKQALDQWRHLRPHYQSLRYVIFFGLVPPPEIEAEAGVPIVQDAVNQYTVFDLAAKR